jgi:hypothetical protein
MTASARFSGSETSLKGAAGGVLRSTKSALSSARLSTKAVGRLPDIFAKSLGADEIEAGGGRKGFFTHAENKLQSTIWGEEAGGGWRLRDMKKRYADMGENGLFFILDDMNARRK